MAVVPEETVQITLEDVVDHLTGLGVARRKLPEQLTTWDGPLPRTPSGKMIRARLVMDAPSMRSEFVSRVVPN